MFFFSVIYLCFLIIIRCVDNFFIFWSIIEFRTLIFIGLSYSAFKNRFSRLLIFFIIQSYSAFMMLIFFCINYSVGFTFSILLKLSIFPFYFWYLRIIPLFNNFIFFFSSTFFKIPSIFIIYNFYFILDYKLLLISRVLTILIGALPMLIRNDLRFIIISSSVINNSWFVFSQIVRLLIFFLYILTYFLFLIQILFIFNSNSSVSYSITKDSKPALVFSLFTLAGLPPFPLFYIKVLIVFNIITNINTLFIVLFLFIRILTLIGYLKYVFTIIMFEYTNQCYFILN